MPRATANAVGTTNSKVITLRVIAILAMTYPEVTKPSFVESGKPFTRASQSNSQDKKLIHKIKPPPTGRQAGALYRWMARGRGEPGCRAKDPRARSERAARVPTRRFCEHSVQTVYLNATRLLCPLSPGTWPGLCF